MRNIPCEFEISTYNTLCSIGPPKVLAESRKNVHGGHLVFQNEAKNIPRQDFMAMNISCKFEKTSNCNKFYCNLTFYKLNTYLILTSAWFGFVEQNVSTDKYFLKEFSCRQVTPCLRMSAHAPYSLSTGNC